MKLSGKRVLVIGLGESGLAMAKWLTRQGAVLRVADSRMQPPNVAALREFAPQAELLAGPFGKAMFEGIELITISPGVPLQEPQVLKAAVQGRGRSNLKILGVTVLTSLTDADLVEMGFQESARQLVERRIHHAIA